MFKRLVTFALTLCLLLALAACGGDTTSAPSEDTGTASATETGAEVSDTTPSEVDATRTSTADSDERYEKLSIGLSSDPENLSPFDPNAGSKPYLYFNFYECLFDLENNEYIPVLAEEVTEIDELHTQVKIYDYIYDHAGNHITADDVVFSYETLIDSGYAIKYGAFSGIEKVDEYTVEFTWNYAIDSVGMLEFPWCRTFIFSQKAYEEGNFATNPVGTGAYKVTEFTSGSKVVMEANDNYWQTDESKVSQRHKANVQTLEYDIITETSQHVIALQTGAIDFSQYVPDENVSDFEGNEDFSTYVTAGSRTFYINCNTSEGLVTGDVNFRQAVFYAIDNESLAAATNGTVGAKALGSSFFGDYQASWEDEETYVNTYDPELAKELLAKTGYNGETLVLMTGNDEINKNLVTMIQAFLLGVGIKVEISMVETAQAGNFATEEGAWDLFVHDLGGGSQLGAWNRMLNREEFANGMAFGFINDDTLQDTYMSAQKVVNYGPESITELHNYVLDNGYADALVCVRLNMVYSSDIANVFLREGSYLLPGACDYYLD